MLQKWMEDYMSGYRKAVENIPLDSVYQLIKRLSHANADRKQIFVFGNGGSAANASHFVNDMAKSASDVLPDRFKCLSLNENMSLITAISNDYAYKDIFRRQIENFADKNDLLLTLSVSGDSPNLVEAVEWANNNDVHTIALLGGKRGKLADLAKESIIVDSIHYGHVEDIHMLICHMIIYAFMENPGIVNSIQ